MHKIVLGVVCFRLGFTPRIIFCNFHEPHIKCESFGKFMKIVVFFWEKELINYFCYLVPDSFIDLIVENMITMRG